MKKLGYVLTILICTLLAGSTLAGNGWGNGPGNRAGGAGSQPPPALTDQELADLLFLREEEKMARDTYYTLFEIHGESIFAHIATSEQNHMDAMLNMLVLYGIPDPVGDNDIGVFENEVIEEMYFDRISKGELSLLDALEVGVMIEVRDIADLMQAISNTSKDPLINSYSNLLEGSRRHLQAFENQIAGLDGAVVSPILSPDYLDQLRNRCQQQGGHNGPR